MLKIVQTDPRAIIPTRAYPTDIGYDLTAIDVFKVLSDQTIIYETGIVVQPPLGYYIEILPRSSITKTGYMLANSVGIIDPSYSGSLKIAVRKIDNSFPDFELPFCKFQIIMRKAEYFDIQVVETVDETERGDGGFGSTDNEVKPLSKLRQARRRLEAEHKLNNPNHAPTPPMFDMSRCIKGKISMSDC